MFKRYKKRTFRNESLGENFSTQSIILYTNTDSISSSDSENDESLIEILSNIKEGLIKTVIDDMLTSAINESLKDIISASLLIFSSSIVDSYILNVLKNEVYFTVILSIEEVKNSIVIDIQEKIIEKVILEDFDDIVYESFVEFCSEIIVNQYINELNIENIIEGIVLEEKNMIFTKAPLLIIDSLVECILKEDWLELIVEDELICAKLNENYKLMPAKIQKELAFISRKSNPEYIIEELYFDMINDYVGNIWIENIVRDCLFYCDNEQNFEQLMPIHAVIKNIKRRLSLYSKGLAGVFISSYIIKK